LGLDAGVQFLLGAKLVFPLHAEICPDVDGFVSSHV